jgi:hypothetical protein
MTRTKRVALSMAVVFALSAVAAASASAKLELKEHGINAPVGAEANSLILFESCELKTNGGLTVNGKATDKATFGGVSSQKCTFAYPKVTGHVEKVSLTELGVATYATNIVVTEEDGCAYKIGSFTEPFNAEHGFTGNVVGTGFRGTKVKGSPVSCNEEEFYDATTAVVEAEGQGFETEIL